MFQHTAARRRLPTKQKSFHATPKFQHTAARRRLLYSSYLFAKYSAVSTHSRPKAAAKCSGLLTGCKLSFNTQPPEGGCITAQKDEIKRLVSTHSRPKAAAYSWLKLSIENKFQHTAARRRLLGTGTGNKVR